MLILILLLLFPVPGFPVPGQNGKVVINTGVPGAEIYLDGNLVYTTDQSGTVPMEVPAGSFNLTIKKQGYKPYSISFAIREGESRLIKPALEKLAIAERSPKPLAASPGEGKLPGKKAIVAAQGSQAKPDSLQKPVPPAAAEPVQESLIPVRHESRESAVLPVIALLCAVALLIFGFLIWKRKGEMAGIPIPDSSVETEDPEPQESMSSRPEPPFIEELKRKEELLKAGFVTNQTRVAPREQTKEKEVVIVLPKEAFRYEEDK